MTFFVQLGYGLSKQSSSKLRSLVELIKHTPLAPAKFEGQLRQYQHWMMKLNGNHIGRLIGHESPDGFRISESYIDPRYRGFGLGKKLYGEVMKQAPQRTLHSDRQVSDAASRIWTSMSKRPGYQVTQSPAAVPIRDGLHTNVSDFNDQQQTAYQKTTPLLKQVFGIGQPAPVKTPEVFKAKLNIPG